MNYKSFYLILFFLIGSPLPLEASQCYDVSFNHLKAPEGSFCFDCLSKRTNNYNAIQTTNKNFTPSLSCFKQSITQRKRGRNRVCPNGSTNNLIRTSTPLCPSDNYTKTTARVFHEVSECLDIKNPSYFFALINRESRFQITAESGTGASCYGQLTGVAIADINQRFIPLTVKNINKCKNILENWETLKTSSQSRKTKSAICTASSNPYSCMTYSAIYYKESLNRAKQLVDSMDIITIKLKSDPKKTLIFRDQNQYRKYFNKKGFSNVKSETRISLFQDKNIVAQAIALQGYNGGPQNIRNKFKVYANGIKKHLWSKNKLGRIYKKEMFSKKPFGISPSDFIETFGNYVTKNYRSETGNFAKNVFLDFASTTKGLHPSCGNLPASNLIRPDKQFTARGI